MFHHIDQGKELLNIVIHNLIHHAQAIDKEL